MPTDEHRLSISDRESYQSQLGEAAWMDASGAKIYREDRKDEQRLTIAVRDMTVVVRSTIKPPSMMEKAADLVL